jgi:hypothetical protein
MVKAKTSAPAKARTDMTPKELANSGITVDPKKVEHNGTFGWCIAVADRGFVWIGNCLREGDSIFCTQAYNVRSWGTTKGLGQLALTGPTKETELDPVPCVIMPMRAIIAMIPADRDVWKDY